MWIVMHWVYITVGGILFFAGIVFFAPNSEEEHDS